jgi:hypothetical protein
MRLMAERGHPAGRVDRARRALEVETIRQGPPGSRQTFYWQLPTSCPTCSRPFGPDETPASAPWGIGPLSAATTGTSSLPPSSRNHPSQLRSSCHHHRASSTPMRHLSVTQTASHHIA